MRADVALYGTQKTLPLGSKTPPMYAELPGYVPVGVVKVSVTGS